MNSEQSFLARACDQLRWRIWDRPRGLGRPSPAEVFDAEYASRRWNHFADDSEAPRYRQIAGLIAESGDGLRVLDAGCGSGQLARVLTAANITEYLGLDLSQEALRRARESSPAWARFEHGDFETAVPTDDWDVIVFNECLGYMRDPARTLQRWAKHLTPRGTLLVSYYRSGNYKAVWRRIDKSFSTECADLVVGPLGHEWDVRRLCART